VKKAGRQLGAIALGLWAATAASLAMAAASAPGLLNFSEAEKAAILRHGPWPGARPRETADTLETGRLAAAQALGQRLFFDTRLSAGGKVACATCHQPGQAFSDGRARARGLSEGPRNSPSLWNAGQQRWQGWDGGADSVWAQAIRALLEPREMGGSAAQLRALLVREPDLTCRYVQAFGKLPSRVDEQTAMVHAAQAMGAFVATLVSPRTPFDDFRDALAAGDAARAARYPLQAQQGLRIFVGKGQCALCHMGPLFSNGEFADIGLPFFSQPGVVDQGRYGGIEQLKASPYTRLSHWAGAADAAHATATRHVDLLPRNFGEFKVPSLRHVAQTAPYMHDGQLSSLADVVRHYDQMNQERLHTDGEQILRPLKLSAQESLALQAFLESLSYPDALRWRAKPEPASVAAACEGGKARNRQP
jgi:cytochrome c peroxidase